MDRGSVLTGQSCSSGHAVHGDVVYEVAVHGDVVYEVAVHGDVVYEVAVHKAALFTGAQCG
jgi:hypothetical protein